MIRRRKVGEVIIRIRGRGSLHERSIMIDGIDAAIKIIIIINGFVGAFARGGRARRFTEDKKDDKRRNDFREHKVEHPHLLRCH